MQTRLRQGSVVIYGAYVVCCRASVLMKYWPLVLVENEEIWITR